MDDDLHQRAKELFARAIAVPAEARDALLRESGEPEGVVEEVRALLIAPAEGFLETPALGGGTRDRDRWVGKEIGGCRVVDVLGSGGMGVVLLAEQRSPSRLVAIKVLGTGLVSEERERRFRYEAEVLARLNHPGIATVHEVGLWDGGNGHLPYFVMENVEEPEPVTEYAMRRDLSIRDRVEMFTRVCDAVAHGHHRGVVHRDLKPENILIDKHGQPKVIDFGIARCTAEDFGSSILATLPGAVLGTVQYMSPEHCKGAPRDIDTRSDVYSLGVILYELLSGRPPRDIKGRSFTDAIRAVCEGDITEPRRVTREIDRQLERVILKALERDPSKRYHSAADLASDLRRWASGEMIEAAPATKWCRIWGWIARHPLLSTTAACVGMIAASLAMTAGIVWWVNFQPFTTELSVDGTEAYVVSVSGRRLRTVSGGTVLPTDPTSNLPQHLIEFVRRVDVSDSRWLALIGFNCRGDSPWSGRLIAIDPRSRADEPVWVSEAGYPDFVAPDPTLHGARDLYSATAAYDIADVFATDGPEIIIVMGHQNFSASCVQVRRAATGEVLFEAWHDGSLGAVYYCATTGQIIGTGLSNRLVGDDVGKPGERLVLSEDGLFPRVVFAITPERGQRRTGWIGSSDSDAACRADWYKYVDLPPHVQVDVNAARPDRSFSAGDHVAVSVQIKGTAQGLTLTLRADGSEVERFRSSTMEEPMQAVLADVRLIDVKGYDPNLRARVYRDRVLPEVDSGTP